MAPTDAGEAEAAAATADPEQVKVDEAPAKQGEEDYCPVHWQQKLNCELICTVYWFVAKGMGWGLFGILLSSVPVWLVSHFFRPGVSYTMAEFRDACAANQTHYEDPTGMVMVDSYKRLWAAGLSGIVLPLSFRAEYMYDKPLTEENAKTVRKIRYCWMVPMIVLCFISNAVYIAPAGGSGDPPTEFPFFMFISQVTYLMNAFVGATAIIRQGCKVEPSWFASNLRAAAGTCCIVVITLLNIGVAMFIRELLMTYGSAAQMFLLLFSKAMELCMKHSFVQLGIETGVFGCYAALIAMCFTLPIRIYSFVRPTLADTIFACLLSCITSVAGHFFNFCLHTVQGKRGKVVPEKYMKVINVQGTHKVYVSHVCNMVALLVLILPDSRYFGVSPGIGMGVKPPADMIVLGFVISTIFELCADFIMFILVNHSQPRADIIGANKSNRMQKVYIYFATSCLVIMASHLGYVRRGCLVCGANLPNIDCYDS